jgi:SAM-dependent methyltransferase
MNGNRWDQVYSRTEYHYGVEPNSWIRETVERYLLKERWFAPLGITQPEEIAVVELAAGEGRNAVWLAERGFQVTAFDRSGEGLRKAVALAEKRGTRITARTDDVLALPDAASYWQESAAVVVSTFFHVPPELKRAMFAAHAAITQPGGLLFAEWFHPDQRTAGYESGGPPSPEMMVTAAELREHFAEWHILTCRETVRHLAEGAGHAGDGAVTQFAARKPV